MTENKRVFFVKRAGRITGPFTMTKLKLMVDQGLLDGKDLFSTEKTDWKPVSRLFPEVFPAAEPAAPEISAEKGETPPSSASPVSSVPDSPLPEPAAPPFLPSPRMPSSVQVSVQTKDTGHVPLWLRDTAALIVLPWDFGTEAPLLRAGKGKLISGALILNLLPSSLLLALSCRQYAFRMPCFLAPLFAAGLLLLVGVAAAAAARIIAGFRLPPGTRPPEEWKLLAIALFVDYGALCGTFMTFYPCFKGPDHPLAGALLSGMAVLLAADAATLLLGSFLRHFRAVPAKWSFFIVPVLTSGMVGMICFLIDLIRN